MAPSATRGKVWLGNVSSQKECVWNEVVRQTSYEQLLNEEKFSVLKLLLEGEEINEVTNISEKNFNFSFL
jgi:hypothetical protein